MNSSDFADWKRHPVTQAIFLEIKRLQDFGKEELALTAGMEPVLDARKVGKIAAFQDILDISFEEVTQDD